MEESVLRVLERGERNLDDLEQSLSEMSWAQLFFAIDRLSRAGKIRLRRAKDGHYIVSGKIAVA